MDLLVGVILAMGFALLVVVFLWLRSHGQVLILRAREQSYLEQMEREKKDRESLKDELKMTFESLTSQAFKGSHQELFQSVQQHLIMHKTQADKELSENRLELQSLVQPLQNSLQRLSLEVSSIEKARQKSYTQVEDELKRVVANSIQLATETRALKEALKKPHIRGRWGEIQLKNCVELSGMSEFCDVTFQEVNSVDKGLLIPDMVVRMPGGRKIVVDSKTPLDGFLASLEAKSEDARKFEMERHGKQVKNHIKELSRKAYGNQLDGSADFTVMFLPNESFLYAALENQPDLVEYAIQKKILLATPPTFIGLLKVIHFGWNEEKMSRNAEEISDLGKELHKRLVDFVEAFVAIGKSLRGAQDQYDVGLKRLQSRVIVQAKKMESMGAKGIKDWPAEL